MVDIKVNLLLKKCDILQKIHGRGMIKLIILLLTHLTRT